LNKDYAAIFSNYSTNTKRNIKKANDFFITIKNDLSANEFLSFYHATIKNYPVPSEIIVNRFIEQSIESGKITLYGAYNINNELVSALCLLHSHQRFIYLMPVSNAEGKETLAMFKIVDEVIKNYANSNFVIDFEGSKIGSIATFYQGFGAKLFYYYEIKHWSINDLIKFFHCNKI
jgi:hypothetical protein